jgi:2-oxoisovalerate dehydrogenase E2 component (dihydrolipoyl transacylase)
VTERDFLLPDLGEGLEEAEINRWRVDEGDRVELNQPLVDVDTAKALVEIPSPFAGVVVRRHAEEGAVVKVGEPLVTIAEEGDRPVAAGPEAPAAAADAGPGEPDGGPPRRRAVLVGYGVEEEEPAAPSGPAAEPGTRRRTGPVRASPPVRKLARELGVDLGAVEGTGNDGRVTREDVENAARPAGPGVATGTATGDEERIAVRGPRRLIAEKMSRSWREIPHVTTFLTVDATQVLAFRDDLEAQTGTRVGPLAIVVRAVAETCREHRLLNASFDAEAGEIVLHGGVNVGIATDTERGLVVPVVRGVEGLGIRAVAERIAELVDQARAATIGPEAFAGGTITVTNVGTFGSEFGTPIINHPEGSILALGVIEPRPVVVDGRVEARPAVTLSLSFDHRLLDGAQAGRALRALADLLESPFRLGALPR